MRAGSSPCEALAAHKVVITWEGGVLPFVPDITEILSGVCGEQERNDPAVTRAT